MRELVIDSFAGGGGASEGIRMALERDPDIAVNHDRYALAMHRVIIDDITEGARCAAEDAKELMRDAALGAVQ